MTRPDSSPSSRLDLESLLAMVASGELDARDAAEKVLASSYLDIGIAKLDLHRELRSGTPEAVLAEGKTADEVSTIVSEMVAASGRALVTRLCPDTAARLCREHAEADYSQRARILTIGEPLEASFRLAVLAAGTSDLGVAEEAALCASWLGASIDRHWDVGVAGLHRLLASLEDVRRADVVIVAAGMDGALPSVVAGLVRQPVIALPTSVGYGASFDGLAALLTMLNSCSPGVAVVNIDNGYGAAVLAARIGKSQVERSSSMASP